MRVIGRLSIQQLIEMIGEYFIVRTLNLFPSGKVSVEYDPGTKRFRFYDLIAIDRPVALFLIKIFGDDEQEEYWIFPAQATEIFVRLQDLEEFRANKATILRFEGRI